MLKKLISRFFVLLLVSCATFSQEGFNSEPGEPPLSQDELDVRQKKLQPSEQVIGTVNAIILVPSIGNASEQYEKAYSALLETAKMHYKNDIDIRDIEIDYSGYIAYDAQQCPVSGKVIRR
jgi:hypothetical protein